MFKISIYSTVVKGKHYKFEDRICYPSECATDALLMLVEVLERLDEDHQICIDFVSDES